VGVSLTEKGCADILGDLVPRFAGLREMAQFFVQHPLEL
jgi:hypothetical protein